MAATIRYQTITERMKTLRWFSCFFVFFAPINAAADELDCSGTQVQGPWYSFQMPQGMEIRDTGSPAELGDSLWIQNSDDIANYAFFLFAPRVGGIPYKIFLDAEEVTDLVMFPNGSGQRRVFVVTYSDGTTGLFDGDSQRMTGFRIKDDALTESQFQKFECFKSSVENFVN